MTLTLLLPWFPIVLAVGVGGRILGRTRGLAMGIVSALFWLLLVQASAGDGFSGQPWVVLSMIAGATAIVAMGRWSGEFAASEADSTVSKKTATVSPEAHVTESRHLIAAVDRFDDWLHEHREDSDPWPKFDEFVRALLYEFCQATHVRPYRLLSGGDDLVALHDSEPLGDDDRLSARRGIVGHVVTTGRPYLFGDASQGELVNRLGDESDEPIAWCFAIRQGPRRLGVVLVGQVGFAPDQQVIFRRSMERLVNQFWCTLAETMLSRSAAQVDPASGLATRFAFLRVAEESLRSSYKQGEPVAIVVMAIEGLRTLNDTGRWEVADEVVRAVSDVLRRKVRMDDQLGRFDDSRMVLLLRRVDSELASLIVAQMMSRVTAVCSDASRWGSSVCVRCGVTGSGTDEPTLRTLMSRALIQCSRARQAHASVASDFSVSVEADGAPA